MTKILVHPKSKSLILAHRNPDQILEGVKPSKLIELKGREVVIVKHTVDTAKALRNIGVEAPSPILHHYTWPKIKGEFDPMSHQMATAEFITLNTRCLVMNSTGTGKTDSILYAADYMLSENLIDKVIITSPISTLHKVWSESVWYTFPERTFTVIEGAAAKRRELLAFNSDITILNPDSLKVLYDELKKFNTKRTLFVIDEASQFRNSTTKLYKALTDILHADQPLVLSTATPTPSAPTDAWALAKLINKKTTPKYFGQFQRMTMYSYGGQFKKWEPRNDAPDIVKQYLQPAIFFSKDECLDLPPTTFMDRDVELTSEQKKLVKEMQRQMATEMTSGALLTAASAADKLGKLRQILCGVIKTGEDEYTPIDCAPRIKLVTDLIEESGHKALVVCPFKGMLRFLTAEIAKAGFTTDFVNGDVTPALRREKFTRFQDQVDPRVLCIHPRVAAHGVNLHEANLLIMYAPIFSNDEFEQLLGRIARKGQKRNMTVVCLGANALEWDIYKRLKAQSSVQRATLDLYKIAVDS